MRENRKLPNFELLQKKYEDEFNYSANHSIQFNSIPENNVPFNKSKNKKRFVENVKH